MKLVEAIPKIEKIVGIPIINLFTPEQMKDLIKNKGKAGTMLQYILGLESNPRMLDFEDGELKTNKCFPDGKPKETMWICQISDFIDSLFLMYSFKESYLFNKIKNLLYVPICKEGKEESWFFLPPININFENKVFKELLNQIEKDYYDICNQLNSHVKNSPDGFIHTSNGKYIQIRSKDAKPYNPIYSNLYKRKVSNKNHGFYFKKEFLKYIQSQSTDYPFNHEI